MIRTVRFTEAAEAEYEAYDIENRWQAPDGFFDNADEAGIFSKGRRKLGYYRIELKDGMPQTALCLQENISFEDACRSLAALSEHCIRTYHPAKILCTYDRRYLHVMQANAYYQKGTFLQKKIEPWRRMLDDSVFDGEGYLINQGKMKDIPFGWFNTMDKGCGWIACYNLLKMCGREQTMQETAEELGRYLFLGGVAGQELYTMLIYMRRKGVNCGLSMSFDASALKCMQESRYGILLYSHPQGAHYTAYRNQGDGKALFYNAVYGRTEHVQGAADFLKERELLPFSSVLYVK